VNVGGLQSAGAAVRRHFERNALTLLYLIGVFDRIDVNEYICGAVVRRDEAKAPRQVEENSAPSRHFANNPVQLVGSAARKALSADDL
jgi:hypothetical protein